MVASDPALALGSGSIVSVILSSAVPQLFVTVSVYVVVPVGLAVGFETDVLLNPAAGDHANEPFPLPFNVAEDPKQIEMSDPALGEGEGRTVTVIASTTVPHTFDAVRE